METNEIAGPLYRYKWTVKADPGTDWLPIAVRLITLDSMGADTMYLRDGDTVDAVGAFGLDLCVRGGRAELDFVTNEVPADRIQFNQVAVPISEDCRDTSPLGQIVEEVRDA